ncbi:hypothetical protein [Roseateles toxinivorans]|uniref:Periplasmic binding family protein n=1 Tax=Roseateles toxinivorans TaxID=270368 RepID=A0A4R6QMH0_9BURK|nr:hypothetical protein [Roseateles toxinivorans]TDP64078.1 hypothetical protein DES47_104366 [Roseateles toxinivorans]
MMKFRLIALAAGLVAAMGSAQALTPAEIVAAGANLKVIHMSGASAQRLAIGSAFKDFCNADNHVYFSKSTGGSNKDGDNHRAYACTLKAAVGTWAVGTPVLFIKRDQGGSGLGVNQVAKQTPMAFMKIDNNAGNCVDKGVPVNGDIETPNFVCQSTENVAPKAGISDVEPAIMNQTVNLEAGTSAADLTKLDSAVFVAANFGVAVNLNAYRKLQQEQGLTQDDADANIPSIPSTFVRGALTGGLNGSAAAKRGWNMLISAGTDANINGKAVNVCRRANGSGTQAVSNMYFANTPCGGSNGLTVTGSTGTPVSVTGSVNVIESTGSGGVISCLSDTTQGQLGTAADPAYALGVLSLENNPLSSAGTKAYRFVKIDGKLPRRSAAQTGAYDFVYEATMQWNKDAVPAGSPEAVFLGNMRSNAGKIAKIKLVDADFQNGMMATTVSYSGGWNALPAADKDYASRVQRTALNSCTPLKLAK